MAANVTDSRAQFVPHAHGSRPRSDEDERAREIAAKTLLNFSENAKVNDRLLEKGNILPFEKTRNIAQLLNTEREAGPFSAIKGAGPAYELGPPSEEGLKDSQPLHPARLQPIITPPFRMNIDLDFSDVRLTLNKGYHGFSSFLFLMLLGTNSFDAIFREQKPEDIELNIIKKHALKVFEVFKTDGIFRVDHLKHLLRKCHDDASRRKTLADKTLALGAAAPIYDLKEGYLYHSRKVNELPIEQPHAIEYMTHFQANFDLESEHFTNVILPQEMKMTVQDFCEETKLVVNTPCVTFVRPEGWVKSEKAQVFPNQEIYIDKDTYALKGVMLRIEEEGKIFYSTLLIEDDDIYTYSNEEAKPGQAQCYVESCEVDVVFNMERCFLKENAVDLKRFPHSYCEFFSELITNSDMFLYEKIS